LEIDFTRGEKRHPRNRRHAHPDETDFKMKLRASVRLLMLEASEADYEWIKLSSKKC
jgi:hypothetical protein